MKKYSRWTDNPFRDPNASPEKIALIEKRHREIREQVARMRQEAAAKEKTQESDEIPGETQGEG